MLFRVAFAAALTAIIVPTAAFAAHGKAGLWESTTTVTMKDTPPQSRTATFCMTPEEVAQEVSPPSEPSSPCTYTNVSRSGNAVSADMVCTAPMAGTGRYSATYDSETHYTSTVAVALQGTSMTNSVEGHWVKADCAGAQH
jgi:hypothetical protein